MCIRHDVSPAVRTSAPEASTSSTLSRPMATDVSAFFTANVPPNPQQDVERGRSTNDLKVNGVWWEEGVKPVALEPALRRLATLTRR